MNNARVDQIEMITRDESAKPYKALIKHLNVFKDSGISYKYMTNSTYNKVHQAEKANRGLNKIQRGQARLISETT